MLKKPLLFWKKSIEHSFNISSNLKVPLCMTSLWSFEKLWTGKMAHERIDSCWLAWNIRINECIIYLNMAVQIQFAQWPPGRKVLIYYLILQYDCKYQRRILHATRGRPGRWNNKISVFDQFVRGIHDSGILDDIEFELFYKKNCEIEIVKYRGGYAIVDNCYLHWPENVPTFKVTKKTMDIYWSRWVESMRKEVNCASGILWGWWCMLKTGVWVQGVNAVDTVWILCCALHN